MSSGQSIEGSSARFGFTVLVNSSDGFEDCWNPFFTLFARYWPDFKGPILLNTETKQWSYPGLGITCSRVQRPGLSRRLTWSECLMAALDQVKTPLVLYLQEDYFFERPVESALIADLATRMLDDPEIKHIGLTHFGSMGPFEKTNDPMLWKIGAQARYRISTQAGLWRADTLRSYLRPEENGWMFEIFGTRRSRRRRDTFLTVNRDLHSPEDTPLVQYTHTGIIKGQWHPAMPELFSKHGIDINFSVRGIYSPGPALLRKATTMRRLLGHPLLLARGLLGR